MATELPRSSCTPWWERALGALFILASAVVVIEITELQFNRVFYTAASFAILFLLVSRHKLAYIAAAFAWMAFRLFIGAAFMRDLRMFALGVVFGAVAVLILVIGTRREERDRLRRWR